MRWCFSHDNLVVKLLAEAGDYQEKQIHKQNKRRKIFLLTITSSL